MTCAEKVTALDALRDELEVINVDLGVTLDLQCIIRSDYDNLNPDKHRLEYVYHNSLVFGDVMIDRLSQIKEKTTKILEKVISLT